LQDRINQTARSGAQPEPRTNPCYSTRSESCGGIQPIPPCNPKKIFFEAKVNNTGYAGSSSNTHQKASSGARFDGFPHVPFLPATGLARVGGTPTLSIKTEMLSHKAMIEQIQAEQRAARGEAGIVAGSPTVSARPGAYVSRRWNSNHQAALNHLRETERAHQLGQRLAAERLDLDRQSLKSTASSLLRAGYQTLRDGAHFIGDTLKSANDFVKQVDVFPNFPAVQGVGATNQAGFNNTDLLDDAATVADFRAMAESLGFHVRIKMTSTIAKSETGQTYYETTPAYDEATEKLNGKLIILGLHNGDGFDPNALLLAEQIARAKDGMMTTTYAPPPVGKDNAVCANLVPAEKCISNANYCRANGLYNDILESTGYINRFIIDLSDVEQKGMIYELNDAPALNYVQAGHADTWGELWMRPGDLSSEQIPTLWCNTISQFEQSPPFVPPSSVPEPSASPEFLQTGAYVVMILMGGSFFICTTSIGVAICVKNKSAIKSVLKNIESLILPPATSSSPDDAEHEPQHELKAVRTAPQQNVLVEEGGASSSSEYLGDAKSKDSE
jgi:hypothetical protein